MKNKEFKIGVIISTYNNPAWLEKVLWGYLNQTVLADEIIIADDGSGPETRNLIEAYSDKLPLKHVWYEDNGFQKTKILNKAIVSSSSDYLIFTDQDCIPRKDFIETHRNYAQEKYFLSGGYFKLPMPISSLITEKDIERGNAFDFSWLHSKGLKYSFKCTKLTKNSSFSSFMNAITPAKASWNGCNSSCWKKDILQVNGFNEEMQYGGEDREFGERLNNLGLKSKQIRYSAIAIHLDHKRPYRNTEAIKKNEAIRKITRKNKIIRTEKGIDVSSSK
ncbi:MAG: glycosyltransferase family 2 protein [Bacteroidales bacterium]|nr:glycosyltransferase family 2 protein [Bacteroidales bacterium]